jgi:predicted O-methyltransferase YrrM
MGAASAEKQQQAGCSWRDSEHAQVMRVPVFQAPENVGRPVPNGLNQAATGNAQATPFGHAGRDVTETILRAPSRIDFAGLLFPAAIFTSASLVFLVEPMVAKLLLPKLGGSPAVWNASMAFFQAMLLAGYAYAHLLQKIKDLRLQAALHLLLLLAASAVLPLSLSPLLGDPSPDAPVRWLLAVLILSVGAPFAVLSATAPLLQAWFARIHQGHSKGVGNPYALYVASNVGSILALLAYPIVVEPLFTLKAQTHIWAGGYAFFTVLAVGLAIVIARTPATWVAATRVRDLSVGSVVGWRDRALWVVLAAAPSSLMLGVTTYISTDVAAAPFMWVLPLALYLVTFIIAFQSKPMIGASAARVAQSFFVPLCLVSMPISQMNWALVLALHACAFFVTALVCHQALSARRPQAGQLTEFYFFVSLGGVIGGATTAFVAPVVFNLVLEYPLVMVLAVLARPWNGKGLSREELILVGVSIAAAAALFGLAEFSVVTNLAIILSLTFGLAVAILLRKRALPFAIALAALAMQAVFASGVRGDIHTVRSFFGVNRVGRQYVAQLGGEMHTLAHGTTLHGSQALAPAFRCHPTSYYTQPGTIGRTFLSVEARRSNLNLGVVGLGAGAMATYVRPGDRLRFFEIDPAVGRIARDPRYFTYLSDCAKGPVDVVLGDARLTLARESSGSYDILLLDAFTSDAIPTHLLTTEALDEYLSLLKPGGVLLLHISNRHLALEAPIAATAAQVGAQALIQNYRPASDADPTAAASDVMLVSRSPELLARFTADPRWRPAHSGAVRAWTDDYTNVIGALIARAMEPDGPRKL